MRNNINLVVANQIHRDESSHLTETLLGHNDETFPAESVGDATAESC